MQGRLDSPLTEQGREQASLNGSLLKSLGGVEQLWVSPSGRTTETAYLVNSHAKARIEFAEELMERDCGQWSGKTTDEIRAQFPQAWTQWETDPYRSRPPDGENYHDMLRRVYEFLDSLFDAPHSTIGLVTHGVMSKVILKYYLGLSELESTRTRHPNDLVYRLTFTAQDIETHHFLAGTQAVPGLLRHQPALETHPAKQ